MSNHTPGPWGMAHSVRLGFWTVAGVGGFVADVFDDEDARLITAAPEMLEALETVERAYQLGNVSGDSDVALIEYVQAINKAERMVGEALEKVRGTDA